MVRGGRHPTQVQAAKTLASVMRKIEFLNLHGGQIGLTDGAAVLDAQVTANLGGRFEQSNGARPSRKPLRALLGLAASSRVLPRLLATDRFLQARLQGSARRVLPSCASLDPHGSEVVSASGQNVRSLTTELGRSGPEWDAAVRLFRTNHNAT